MTIPASLKSIRFFIEFIKLPQVDFENTMILNMGQLLSIPFIIVGAILLYRSRSEIDNKK
ncbi:MAG: hypothetical protein CL661_01980 [Bacteroidetes bacterium]|nr:hypothetical protein [Bacteroidota bacterium]